MLGMKALPLLLSLAAGAALGLVAAEAIGHRIVALLLTP